MENNDTFWQSDIILFRLMDVFFHEATKQVANIREECKELLRSTNVDHEKVKIKEQAIAKLNPLEKHIRSFTLFMERYQINVANNVSSNGIDKPFKSPLLPSNPLHSEFPEFTSKDNDQLLKYFVFGFIRQQSENINITNGLKEFILQFHGNFITNSNILAGDITIHYVLCSILNRKYLTLHKLFDSKYDGLNGKIFNEKCKNITNTVCVALTNFGHIIVSYSKEYWHDLNKYDIRTQYTFLLKKSYKSSARMLKPNAFIFPNKFDSSILENKRMENVLSVAYTELKEKGFSNFPGNENCVAFDDNLTVTQCELFKL
eukprot:415962_1